MLNLLLKEESWLLVATTSAVLAVVALVIQTRRRHAPPMIIVASALSLFWGLWIGIMGTGHVFAVTTKSILGTLPPGIHLWFAIPFGFAMAIPGWWLVANTRGLTREEQSAWKRAILLNGWLTLVVIAHLPLPLVAGLNVILLAIIGKRKSMILFAGSSRRDEQPIES